jgi:hypothetical protein
MSIAARSPSQCPAGSLALAHRPGRVKPHKLQDYRKARLAQASPGCRRGSPAAYCVVSGEDLVRVAVQVVASWDRTLGKSVLRAGQVGDQKAARRRTFADAECSPGGSR